MYTLICNIGTSPLYSIVHLPTYSWCPCIDGSNWFDSITQALEAAFSSGEQFYVEEQEDEDIYFQQFTSVEDYCIALGAHPDYISPIVICHFESTDDLFTHFPELLI